MASTGSANKDKTFTIYLSTSPASSGKIWTEYYADSTSQFNLDFDTDYVTGSLAFNPITYAVGKWDTAKWDQSSWGGKVINKNWQSVTGIGYCASLQLTAASQGITVRWASTDFVLETGGVI